MTGKTVKEIVAEYLKANKFDGLYNGDLECDCGLGDFMPCAGCDEWMGACETAKFVKEKGEDGEDLYEPAEPDTKTVPVILVFDDWRKTDGESAYNTEKGLELSSGDFHSGTVFHAVLLLSASNAEELSDAMADGFQPVFWALPAEPEKGGNHANASS